MRYTAEQKLQIEIIKGNNVFMVDCDDYAFVCDGHKGCYIKKDELKINPSRFKRMNRNEMLQPKNVLARTHPAKMTNEARIVYYKEIAVKIKSENGKYAWVRRDWLKEYGDCLKFQVGDHPDDGVAIMDMRDELIGLIMPIKIPE